MITCHDSRKFGNILIKYKNNYNIIIIIYIGPHGGISGVILKKYYQLPPHWSISISMEAYLLWTWTTGVKYKIF